MLAGEDAPVAGRLGRLLGAPRGEVALARRLGVVERVDQARLVGVEQVLLHRQRGGARRGACAGQALDGPRRVDAGAREAGGAAELAQQQPALRGGAVAPGRGRERDAVGAPEQRRAQPAASGRQSHVVAVGRRSPGLGQRAEHPPVGARRVGAQPARKLAAIEVTRALGVVHGRAGTAQQQLRLGCEKRSLDAAAVAPGRRRGRRAGEREQAERDGERCDGGCSAPAHPGG
jgi:hypothetical protein